MKKIIISFLIFAVLQFVFSQQGWFQQVSGTSSNLYNVQFLNSNTGFVCGLNGVFLKTTNGGSNWILVPTNLGTLRQVQFLNSTTGFVLSDTSIYRTLNSGTNWNIIFHKNCSYPYFNFLDINTGYVVSTTCNKTTDGGMNWVLLGGIFGIGGSTDFVYLNDMNMYASGWDFALSMSVYNSRISKSSNGGLNWNINYSSSFYLYLQYIGDLSFPSFSNGYGVGFEQGVPHFYKSTNSGVNWVKTAISYNMNSVCFTDNLTGWIVGDAGSIYHTTNSGTNFVLQSSGVSNNLRKVYMVNNLTGWIVGDGGVILSTTNGGISGLRQFGENVPDKFSLHQNYPNPFNPTTKIRFDIPAVGQRHAFDVRLIVYDILGREVTILVNEPLKPGTYEVEFDGSSFASGAYLYSLITSECTETKKLILLK